ncbi:MAG: hypothetical protein ACSHX6_13340 [Akkermansiaceae bacterium]
MNFQQAISSYKRTWVIGYCLKTLLLLAAILVITIILYGLADSIWALSNSARSILNKLIIAAGILAALYTIYRALRTTHAQLSSLADSANLNPSNKSNNIRAAYDLSHQESPTPLHQYLSQEAQETAATDILTIPLKKKIPLKNITLTALALLTLLAIGFGIRSLHPAAYDTVTQRLLHPSQDIPPYSPLIFNITQQSPSTVYGGDNQVRVKITGAELEKDAEVICHIRDKNTGEIETINTYQESTNTFSKKFTNILHDIEFSFATGKARSPWHSISVVLQPKFTTATIKITPPAYTKQPTKEFPLEGNEINVITGSNISLSITSNRPLSGGELTVKPITESENQSTASIKENIINANPITTTQNQTQNQNQVTFDWTANNSTSISCLIQDIRNTPSAAPLEFAVITRADLAPAAELISPARYVLATPSSNIPLTGVVEDDYEIDSVYLVRTLVGFRDRAKQLANTVSRQQYDFTQTLDLKSLGVEKDQVLEFYIEANDKNPSLLGVGSSDVVRVKIISEEDYAQSLRNASELKEFNIRYKVLAEAIRNAVKSLRTLNEANKENQAKNFDQARDAAIKTHLTSHLMARKIGEDFEAYQLEAALTDTAMEIAEKLITNHGQLQGMRFDSGEIPNAEEIKEMTDRLGASLEKAQRLEKQANDLKGWGEVAQQAAIFKKLLNNQQSIASRITNIAKELQKGINRNAQRINTLGNTQKKNKTLLLKFAKDLKKAAADLPPEHAPLQADVTIWLEKLAELNIPDPMDTVTLSAQLGKSHDAADNAFLAYSLMQQLVDMENNLFAELLRNKLPKDKTNEELHETMKQLLNALHNKNEGQGEGQGGGGGGGGQLGEGGAGAGGGGQLLRNQNTPMFGPDRSKFSDPSIGLGSSQSNNPKGKQSQQQSKVSENNSIESKQKRTNQTSQATRTNIPNKYKDAIKRFYTDPEPKE